VQVVVLVHVTESLQRLEHNVADHLLREEFTTFAHQLVNVQVEVLKHEVQGVLLETNLVKAHNIRMRKLH